MRLQQTLLFAKLQTSSHMINAGTLLHSVMLFMLQKLVSRIFLLSECLVCYYGLLYGGPCVGMAHVRVQWCTQINLRAFYPLTPQTST